jgi:hypothetical protein
MQRVGLPDEVGATVAWWCSDEAPFITGAVIPVDGATGAGLNGGWRDRDPHPRQEVSARASRLREGTPVWRPPG